MKKEYEAQYHLLEEGHWWFQGRRDLVHKLVLAANPDRSCRILEIGCSGGPLIRQLHGDGYRRVTGIDISTVAIEICRERGLTDTYERDAQAPEFDDATFDVITASDVLEHLVDAPRALHEWHRILKPGGSLIVFVPAFQFLWSDHDEVNKHFQRYRLPELGRLLTAAGFAIERASYWNFLVFWPAAVIRLLRRFLPKRSAAIGDIRRTHRILNHGLVSLLRFENRLLLKGVRYPVGLSAMMICRKLALAG